MPSMVAPGRRRPITRSHDEIGWRSSDVSAPVMSGSCCSGTHMSGGSARSVSPKKPGGVTPATVNAWPSMTSVAPTIDGIAAVQALPGVIGQHHDRRGGRPRRPPR